MVVEEDIMGFLTKLLPLILLSLLAFPGFKAYAQTYLPVGPQTNVSINTIIDGGWEQCYTDTYDVTMDSDTVLARCTGGRLMLACLETGSSVVSLLAQGERSDVTFDTGNTQDLHIANGVGWYFNDDSLSSWGFVRAGDAVSKENCDIAITGANDERLCWHLNDVGGYRCGAVVGLNDSQAFQRVVFQPAVQTSSIPTLSEWGLMAMAGILSIAVLLLMRRRKATA